MLQGISIVSKEDAAHLEDQERRRRHKSERRNHKKKRHKEKRKEHRTATSDREVSPSSSGRSGEDEKLPAADHVLEHGDNDRPPSIVKKRDMEVQGSVQPSGLHREDWMIAPMGRSLAAPPSKPKEEALSTAAALAPLELNPYLRSGDGLPPADQRTNESQIPKMVSTVGDGGASWRMKALKRAQSQASGDGKTLSDVVSERWGSVTDLTRGISENKTAHAMAHARAARDRRGRGPDPGTTTGTDTDREYRAHRSERNANSSSYLSELGKERGRMRRPSESDLSMSWRQDRPQERKGFVLKPSSASGEGSGSETGGENRGKTGHALMRSEPRAAGQSDTAVLAAAVPQLNEFANDGSFMEQFLSKHNTKDKIEATGPIINTTELPALPKEGPPPLDSLKLPPDVPPVAVTITHRHVPKTERRLSSPRNKVPTSEGGGLQNTNKSAAAMLRERLGGKAYSSRAGPHHETVVLPLIDASGRAVPGAFGRESAGVVAGEVRPTKRVERFEGGERKRYYGDDDAVDLNTLVKRTKYEGAADIDATMARNIASRPRFRESDLDADNEYDFDGGLELADARGRASKESRRRGSGVEEAARREVKRQVGEYRRFESAVDRCEYCFTSKSRQKHLTLAIGTAAYLALPPRGRLVPGHCQIVPVDHVASSRAADETTWTEMRNFKKCLLRMFASQGMECVFVESAPRPGDARAHAVVDCVPMPGDAFGKAPMYFKKAVDDATSDWAQHAAKRYIDTAVKGLQGTIPPNFPYFHVEFGLAEGFVHVIDDVDSFDRDFGRRVLIGLLELPEEDMHRRARRESVAIQERWAAEFRKHFDEYDWTKQL